MARPGRQTAIGARRTAKRCDREPAEAGLGDLANVGRATLKDFEVLGIRTVAALARREPFALYRELCRRTGQRHDPCVIDVFLAASHEARGGPPRSWWEFTGERKARLSADPGLARWEPRSE
ncbi:MAG: mitomycin resistance protein [Phycisphaerales bacterium]|nr:mitomycin resistance protein [Phycisphaerales bacterium]